MSVFVQDTEAPTAKRGILGNEQTCRLAALVAGGRDRACGWEACGLDPGDTHGWIGFERGDGVVGQGFHADQPSILHMGQEQHCENPRVSCDGLAVHVYSLRIMATRSRQCWRSRCCSSAGSR